jgi:hypothetical protein
MRGQTTAVSASAIEVSMIETGSPRHRDAT